MPKRVVILGATGSIGDSTLHVIRTHPEAFQLVGIAALQNIEKLKQIAEEFSVKHLAIIDESSYQRAKKDNFFNKEIHVYPGKEGLSALATLPECDIVVIATNGIISLDATLAAIRAQKEIALANKETLIVGGQFVMDLAKKHNVLIRPIDSEHSAIFQCLNSASSKLFSKITLTASGGAFRKLPLEQLRFVKVADALNHPTWRMGAKITIDCATMANKGLEIIETHWLFNAQPSQIEAVIHPQSIIHAIVDFIDGTSISQMAPPSMTIPIQYALTYPNRLPKPIPSLDFSKPQNLELYPMDYERFPCFKLAEDALKEGGTAPAIFNAANEVAVKAFMEGKISYLEIARIIAKTLEKMDIQHSLKSIDDVLEEDRLARKIALEFINHPTPHPLCF